jgi:hypothetical protein
MKIQVPVPARPVGANRLAVRFDPQAIGGRLVPKWAVVSETPLVGKRLVGYKRGFGENHAGLYAYRFRTQGKALKVALQVLAGHPIQDGLA